MINRFRRGSSTFKCNVCTRLTRETQTIGNQICSQCFDLAGIENEISDGHSTRAERLEEIVELVAEVSVKGGDVSEWKTTFALDAVVAPATAYTFKPYDILQIQRGEGGAWLDFSTLRTDDDARDAIGYVAFQAPGDFTKGAFRIVRNEPGAMGVVVLELDEARAILEARGRL